MTGDMRVQSLVIDPDAVDPEDVEMLQDMVVAALNEALRMAEELQQSELGGAEQGGFDPMSALESLGLGGMGGMGGGAPGRPARPPGQPRRPQSSEAKVSPVVARPPLQRLVTELSKLPGIGNRTAQRLAFHVLRTSDLDARALAQAIIDVKEKITFCEICFNLAEGPRCTICLDERRDPTTICVVEEPQDVIPIERTHEFRGRYHVLGGALSPIDGVEPEDLRLAQLYRRIDGITEVVLATNPTTTGEATALAHRRRAAPARARHHRHPPRFRPAGRRRPRVRRRSDARPRLLRPPRAVGRRWGGAGSRGGGAPRPREVSRLCAARRNRPDTPARIRRRRGGA